MILFKLFYIFFKIGLFTVGGGYAMIPFIEKEVINVNKWISHKDFIEIVAIDTVTPGPLAVNLATFIGYRVAGTWGAVIATCGVVLPSLILVILIAALFYKFRTNKYIQAILSGLKPAVIALLFASIFTLIQNKAIIDFKGVLIALIVFVGVVIFKFNPMWMVIFATIGGLLFYLK